MGPSRWHVEPVGLPMAALTSGDVLAIGGCAVDPSDREDDVDLRIGLLAELRLNLSVDLGGAWHPAEAGNWCRGDGVDDGTMRIQMGPVLGLGA